MKGLFKFIGDVFKPILTILATVLVSLFLISVFSPRFDDALASRVPAWDMMDPAIEQVRAWLDIHQPEEEEPWWRFWR